MKRLILLIVFTLLTFSGCAIFNQMQAIKNLEYEYDSFEIGSPTLSGMTFIVKMKVSNPNKADVSLKKVAYQIFVNDLKVAEGKSEEEFVIKKKSNGIYRTKLIIGYNDASDFVSKFSGGADSKVDVRGEAEFKTSFGTYKFPFKVEKKISEITE